MWVFSQLSSPGRGSVTCPCTCGHPGPERPFPASPSLRCRCSARLRPLGTRVTEPEALLAHRADPRTTLTPPCAPPPIPPGRPPGSEGRRARATSEGTRISQDLVGGSLAIDTLPPNETRIVVSRGPPRARPPPGSAPDARAIPGLAPVPRVGLHPTSRRIITAPGSLRALRPPQPCRLHPRAANARTLRPAGATWGQGHCPLVSVPRGPCGGVESSLHVSPPRAAVSPPGTPPSALAARLCLITRPQLAPGYLWRGRGSLGGRGEFPQLSGWGMCGPGWFLAEGDLSRCFWWPPWPLPLCPTSSIGDGEEP